MMRAPSIRAWLLPRIVFWLGWTLWLWVLQAVLLPRFAALPDALIELLIAAPPSLLTWIGSRLAKNPLETPAALFWKGALTSCLLAAYANVCLLPGIGAGLAVLVSFAVVCGLLLRRRKGVRRVEVRAGELWEQAQSIARLTGVRVNRVLVYRSAQNLPSAVASQKGVIILSESLLGALSRTEADAVIAHEAAHLRRSQRWFVSAIPILTGVAVMVSAISSAARTLAPFWPLAGLLLWRAVRRQMEYAADASALRVTGNPEALIAALTRVSSAAGLPLHWSSAAGLFMAHPSMTARFRAISRRAGISDARTREIVSAATAEPPAPGYPSPLSAEEPDALALHLDRMQRRMGSLNQAFPIAAGVGFAILYAFVSPVIGVFDFLTPLALAAGWILLAMLLFWVSYEVVAGRERQRLRDSLPAHDGDACFTGLSIGATPQRFGNSYHCDLGILKMTDGALQFRGARYSFALCKSQVRSIWLAGGPPHWTPRKVVYLEYQRDAANPGSGVLSLQSLERWFWPWTSRAAHDLFAAAKAWAQGVAPDAASESAPPRVAGTALPKVPLTALRKPVGRSCVLSMVLAAVVTPLLPPNGFSVFGLSGLSAPLVTAALALFAYAPHLGFRSSRPGGAVQGSPYRPPHPQTK